MITFTLELINIFILFRYVLGYEFRRARIPIVIGIVLIVAEYLVLLYYVNLPMQIDYVIMLISMLLPLYFFYGKKSVLLGMGASLVTTTELLYNLLYGVGLIVEKGDLEALNGTLISIVLQGMLLSIYCIFAYFLKDKRVQFHWAIEKIHPFAFILFVVVMFTFRLNSYYVGAIDQNTAQVLHASNMVRSGFLGIFVIIICILAIYLSSQKRVLKRQIILNQKCITEQSKQYEFIGEKDQELRKFRHDYNKHVAVLQTLMEKKDIDGLKKYIDELGEVKTGLDFISTNNIICDAITNQYYELCRKKGIDLAVIGKFPSSMKISEVDLCVILSNGMENAYEATQKCNADKRIDVAVKSCGNMILIEITNPTTEKPNIRDELIETTKKDKERHGFGTKNMKDAARRNGGDVTWKYDKQGSVCTSITLFCTDD